MKDLIARYDAGVRARIGEIIANTKPLEGCRPAVVRARSQVTEDAAADHVSDDDAERGGQLPGARCRNGWRSGTQAGGPAPGDALPGTTSAPGIWERKPDDKRWNPYMFMKSPTIVIANGEAIRMPVGRTNIDWECELGVVLGRTADHVSIERAATTSSGTRSRTTCPIAAAAAIRDMAPTGCSARTTTRSRRWARSSCRRSSWRTRRTCR